MLVSKGFIDVLPYLLLRFLKKASVKSISWLALSVWVLSVEAFPSIPRRLAL